MPITLATTGEAVSLRPKVLFASSTGWVWPARLAATFARVGIPLQGVFLPDSPLQHVIPRSATVSYAGARPLHNLARAIEEGGVSAVIPCDDRAAWHLHRLHADPERFCSDPRHVRTVIEHSLGLSAASRAVTSRNDLLALAEQESILVPAFMSLTRPADIDLWASEQGFPAFVKVDGTTGGAGVTPVSSRDQTKHVLEAAGSNTSTAWNFTRYVIGRDRFSFWDAIHGPERKVSIQAAIQGRPANILLTCDRGETTAAICVEARVTHGRCGPATVVAPIRHPQMHIAAKKLVKRLRLSGFVGFDFMIEQSTDRAYLIEMNPRATSIGHLPLGDGADLVEAFCRHLLGVKIPSRASLPTNQQIALFPTAWHTDPAGSWRHEAYHDVPWEEPILMQKIIASVPFEKGLSGPAPVTVVDDRGWALPTPDQELAQVGHAGR